MDLQALLMEEGLVSREDLSAAAEEARLADRSLAEVLVDRSLCAEDVLADAVARAIGSVVIDIELGTLDSDAVRLLPREAASRHLMVAVARAPDGQSLRVAFVDPLDQEAVSLVRELTGLEIEPLVATLSGVRVAIDREYERRDTTVVPSGRDSELPPESTRRLDEPRGTIGAEPSGPGTAPMRRLEQDATIEQRHEALLLALVDAGILTRSDYVAALKRLLGHDRKNQG